MNPKGLAGRLKPAIGLIPPTALMYAAQAMRFLSGVAIVPPVAIIWLAMAFRLGATKYGPFNWNELGKAVEGVTYYEAAYRHLMNWITGEWIDPESGAPHPAHAMACCAILLDANHTGQLIDNRPSCSSVVAIFPKPVRGRPDDAEACYEQMLWHLSAWFCGQWADEESGVPHLAMVMGYCALVMDAQEAGRLIESRSSFSSASDLIVELVELEKARQRAAEAPYTEALDAA